MGVKERMIWDDEMLREMPIINSPQARGCQMCLASRSVSKAADVPLFVPKCTMAQGKLADLR